MKNPLGENDKLIGLLLGLIVALIAFIGMEVLFNPIDDLKTSQDELIKGQLEIKNQIAGLGTTLFMMTYDLRSIFAYLHPDFEDDKNLNVEKFQKLIHTKLGQVVFAPPVQTTESVPVSYSDKGGVKIQFGDDPHPVVAAASGEVVQIEKTGEGECSWTVRIRHDALSGIMSEYRHLIELNVEMGENVDLNYQVGTAKDSSEPCFGFAVIMPGQQEPTDPLPYSPYLVLRDEPN